MELLKNCVEGATIEWHSQEYIVVRRFDHLTGALIVHKWDRRRKPQYVRGNAQVSCNLRDTDLGMLRR